MAKPTEEPEVFQRNVRDIKPGKGDSWLIKNSQMEIRISFQSSKVYKNEKMKSRSPKTTHIGPTTYALWSGTLYSRYSRSFLIEQEVWDGKNRNHCQIRFDELNRNYIESIWSLERRIIVLKNIILADCAEVIKKKNI